MNDTTNDLAAFYFHQGTNYRAYEYLGISRQRDENGLRYTFRTWAPRAFSVAVVGDFNGWDTTAAVMHKVTENGVWEYVLFSEADLEMQHYKYYITGANGSHYKCDPYAEYGQTLTNSASYIYTPAPFEWHDNGWLEYRQSIFSDSNEHFYPAPLNIYELHLASWKTRDGKCNRNGDAYLNYRELAREIVKYVKASGYTHIELMPIAEHPYDGSWGYQICGYYALTSRYGSPEDFKYFVDTLHTNGVGIILDWVPAHFPKDEHGLYEFDGSRLYEYQGDDRCEHKGWGTRCFDVGRNEVQSFLISNALYWLREYHIDGLRVDAVASMLYLDYDRRPGEWTPRDNGDNKNLEAIAFFRKLNSVVFSEFSDVLMIAEESTAFPKITHPVHEGGLGFNFKWNMGWANDMFRYISLDGYFRQFNHSSLTFPHMYAYSENFILPVSHDEVVHGKRSLLDKCSGDYLEKFAVYRAFMVYMMTFPGKKLMFMGQEYGQFREWDYENQLEWFMTDFDTHRRLSIFSAALNHFYLSCPPLWELDFSADGFEWVYPDLAQLNTVVYRRFDRNGNEALVCINFSPLAHNDFEIDALCDEYRMAFTSDDEKYGGTCTTLNERYVRSSSDGRIKINIPALSGIILRPNSDKGDKNHICTQEKNV